MSDMLPNPDAPQSSGVPAQPLPPPPFPVPAPPLYPVPQAPHFSVPGPTARGSRGLYTAAAVLNWVFLGFIVLSTGGLGLIALAWFVPMTILIHKGGKGPYKHTALGVCTLLFCNIISGILMLVDDSNRPNKPFA